MLNIHRLQNIAVPCVGLFLAEICTNAHRRKKKPYKLFIAVLLLINLYQFAGAATIKYYTLSCLNNRNFFVQILDTKSPR